MKYIVISNEDKNHPQTALVEKDEYEMNKEEFGESGYFVNAPNAKVVGEVEITGDVSNLDTCYTSD